MENEQVLDTTAQETTTAQVEPNETKAEEKTYSQAEYDKASQSAASKAKYELLKELGISSVKEFKETYQSKIDEHDTLQKSYNEMKQAFDNEQRKNLLHDVDDEYAEDAYELAKVKAGKDGNLDDAMKAILDKNPNWRKGSKEIQFGNEKSEHTEKNVSSLSKKYPWIK